MDKIKIYTDGGCRGNQENNNVGAWGSVLIWGDKVKELSGAEKNTTNNKMELLACIKALEYVKNVKSTPIEIYTDSAYLCNCMLQKWYIGWQKNGWKNSKKETVANRELWEQILQLINGKNIVFIKVKGHSDNEYNNRADLLCNLAMDEIGA
jgi:ribonuclease HI